MNYIKIFTCLFILSLINNGTNSQWLPDKRLTKDPELSRTQDNLPHCVAATGEMVHVTWQDTRDIDFEIYYKRSTDGGISWGTDKRLTVSPGFSSSPSISVFGSAVYVAWYDLRDGYPEIYYKRSTNDGESWEADKRLTFSFVTAQLPSIAAYGLDIHVVWADNRHGNFEVYYKRSTDGGLNWGGDMRLTNNPASTGDPLVTVLGSAVYVTFVDNGSGYYQAYYKISSDGGITWAAETRLTTTGNYNVYPFFSVLGSDVHAVWTGTRDGNNEIYYKHSPDGGLNWGADKRISINAGMSGYPSVAASGPFVHIVWQDNNSGNWQTHYSQSTNSGLSWSTDIQLSSGPLAIFPSIAAPGPYMHVVWQDARDGNFEIYYKRGLMGAPAPVLNQHDKNTLNTEEDILTEYKLFSNYPNPFNPSTTIKFSLPVDDDVVVSVSDITGKEISQLLNQKMNAGYHEIEFDGSNLSSGVYFYRITTSGFTDVKKMILVK